jgi:serine/threonine protein kinase/Tfp pilus assembly protein PilF
MIGKTISHYKIIEELGRGGMGTVYKAEDTKLDRFVALKFLPPHLSQAEEEKKRFIHEAKAASALDHPNICSIYEINETDDGQMFIAMACYEGESLKEKIAQGPVPVEEAIGIAMQVARGLEKAHSRKIFHRDIKPANILITEDGVVKIVDFGLAKLAGQTKLTKTGSTLGTVAYMSPEQAEGSEVDERTDVWAFGVILYEMLTGKQPFTGDYEQAVIYSIINQEPEPVTDLRSDVPPSLGQIVGRALEKEPEKRYQKVEELLDDLESISAGIVPEEIQTRMRKAKLRRRKRVISYASIVGLIIMTTVIALSLFMERTTAINSIAVLPFENLTGEEEQEFFVDGATEELIGQLAQISALRVISRRSVMQYKGVDKPLPEIARELNVDAVVEGTVYQTGESVRIKVQLIDALPEERNLWTRTYDQTKTDVLMMYKEMARTIANKTGVKLIQQEATNLASTHRVNPEAYEAYLKGRYYQQQWTLDATKHAIGYFQQAIRLDPNYAVAYAGLAEAYAWPEIDAPKAKEAALKALEIDANLGEAHASLAIIHFAVDWDWISADREFKRTLELNPNDANVLHWYSHFLMVMGKTQESIAAAHRAQEIDPLSPTMNGSIGEIYLHARKYDLAIKWLKKAIELDPDWITAYSFLGRTYLYKGMYEDAIATIQKRDYVSSRLLGYAYAVAGRRTEAQEILGQCLGQPKKCPISQYMIALIYGELGEMDMAFKWLEKAYEDRFLWMVFNGVEPALDPLRNDPRFKDLLLRMNLPMEE